MLSLPDSPGRALIACPFFSLLQNEAQVFLLRLQSGDGTNRLTGECVLALHAALGEIRCDRKPIVIAGNSLYFSAGADLGEIAAFDALSAYKFSLTGQDLMRSIEQFPAPVYAAISGYCMGGGVDLALACHRRIAAPHAIFGHRGATLGLITGWGGTQRLPRLVGKATAQELLVAAERITAHRAFEIGLIDALSEDPVAEALRRLST